MLGALIGTRDFCNEHSQKRVAKAKTLLAALGRLPDPQIALKLLRHCGGFCKMAYSARVVPPNAHAPAVAEFDEAVRACFEEFSCLVLDADQWAQAGLATSMGGLGLRSLRKHGKAAFLASRASTAAKCIEVAPNLIKDVGSPENGSRRRWSPLTVASAPTR